VELLAYFSEPVRGQKVKAVPGAGLNVPVWILGSSLFGAQLAAELGLPYAFASHFAPAQMMPAIQIYRSMFRPSEYLDRSRLMLGLNVVAADSDDEAQRLFTSHQQMSLGLRRGELGPLPPPVDPNHFQAGLTPIERAELQDRLSAAVVGAPDTVRAGVADFIRRTSPDELIVAGQIFDHSARVYSYEILKEVMPRLPRAAQSEIQPVLES
jgi:luciferase family oxidoreductase group 1